MKVLTNPKDLIVTNSFPDLLVILGPARSGTTALSQLFVRAGVESHMQPIKAALRAIGNDEVPNVWTINGDPNRTILSKETIGPKETDFFNPIEILINAGYPAEKIFPLFIVRDPGQTLASWFDLWENKGINAANLLAAYVKMEEVSQYCQSLQIPSINFVHDCIKINSSSDVVQKLLDCCGIPATVQQVLDWEHAPKFGDEGNDCLFFYDSPPPRFIDGVRNWGGYMYKERLVPERIQATIPDEVFRIYGDFCAKAENDLGFKVR